MASVLVIDDDAEVGEAVRRILQRAGFVVSAVMSSEQGLKIAAEQPVDVVITDIIMPDKEGLEVIMELSQEKPRPKIIAMSGGGMMEPRTYLSLAEKLGADEVIQKPFRPAELLALVEKLLI